MSNLVHNIQHIFDSDTGYLKAFNKSSYYIPEYQRGYKWSPTEVNKLLEDIDKFKADGDKFYCLQNITLVPNINGKVLNVVDGQQRLTTLVVLLSRLGLSNLVSNRIEYAVRESTHVFLSTYITKSNEEKKELDFNIDWNSFAKENEEFNHQDIYYLYSTAKTIDDWIKQKDEQYLGAYKYKLLNHVKFIVNKIESDNEEKVFGNLNSKRVPLDGADLVRAILITRVANEESEKVGDIKNIVRVNERRVRIGWELDEINTWWSNDEVKGYYSKFIKNRSEGDISFNADKYPINNLLLLFAEQKEKRLSLNLIEEENSALEFYKELIKLHYTLKDWYQDRETYHYLGYIFSQIRVPFKTIIDKWKRNNDRVSFKSDLKEQIRINLFKTETIEEVFNKTEDWYHSDKLVKVLLVLDIDSSLPKERAKLPNIAFAKNNNDIEHIFPQNPPDVKEKKGYIEYLNKYVLKQGAEFDLSNFEEKKDDVSFQEEMEVFINNHIADIDINSIGNLVLLYFSLNRSLGRISYSKKRARIIDFFNNGNFIQPHSFKVFARYFNDGESKSLDLEHWTNIDIEQNKNAIITTLTKFFKAN